MDQWKRDVFQWTSEEAQGRGLGRLSQQLEGGPLQVQSFLDVVLPGHQCTVAFAKTSGRVSRGKLGASQFPHISESTC